MKTSSDYCEDICALAILCDLSPKRAKEVVSALDNIISEVELIHSPQKEVVYKLAIDVYSKITKSLLETM